MSGQNVPGVVEWFREQRESRTMQDWIIDIGPFVMLFALVILFSFTLPTFLSYRNLVSNLLKNTMVLLLVALAGTFPILQQSIDLSVAQMVTLSGVLTIVLISDFGLGLGALPVAVLITALAGTMNGVIFAKLKIPSFLVTLGTLSIIQGLSLIVTGGSSILARNEAVRAFGRGELILAIPNIVIVGLIVYALTIFIAFRTTFGRYTYALGENERVAELSGVKTDRHKILAFSLSGLLCGIAGALLAARTGTGSVAMGEGLLLPSIAAIVMGGTALTGGVGGPHRTIIGVLVIAVLQNGMNLTGVNPFVQEIILGVVVVAAVAMSIDRRKIEIVK